jgi:hypothetical protein
VAFDLVDVEVVTTLVEPVLNLRNAPIVVVGRHRLERRDLGGGTRSAFAGASPPCAGACSECAGLQAHCHRRRYSLQIR